MVGIDIIAVGQLKERYWKEAWTEYEKRLQRYCRLQLFLLPSEPLQENPNAAQIERVLLQEAEKIRGKWNPGSYRIALCVEGKEMDSPAFWEMINGVMLHGTSRITFVIGSSHGLHKTVKEEADRRLSFSQLTFPHQLLRVMLAEQIYRAFQIGTGGSYHK